MSVTIFRVRQHGYGPDLCDRGRRASDPVVERLEAEMLHALGRIRKLPDVCPCLLYRNDRFIHPGWAHVPCTRLLARRA